MDIFFSNVSHSFFSLDEIPKIKVYHMLAKQHPEMIEGRRWLFAVDITDSGDASEDASINNYDASMDEEDGSGLVRAGAI